MKTWEFEKKKWSAPVVDFFFLFFVAVSLSNDVTTMYCHLLTTDKWTDASWDIFISWKINSGLVWYRQDRQWCGFSTHAAPAGYIVHACCPSYIGIFYSIRLHSARMLPLLGIYYSIRLHSARMLPLLGAACVEKPHHWRSCLYYCFSKTKR